MSRKAVPQSVRMDLISESRACRSLSASGPDHLRGYGHSAGVPAVTGKQPDFQFFAKSAPVALKFLQEFWAEHDIMVFAALSAFDMNDHPFTINVSHFQMRQFGTPQSGRIKRHQKDAVEHGRSCIDEPRYLFRAENFRKTESPPWVRCFGNRPGSPQRPHEEESKR